MDRAEPLGNSEDGTGRRALHVKGNFKLTGLNIGMRTTTMEIGDTPEAIPATAFPFRNAIAVLNLSEADTLYIGDETVTSGRALGTSAGWEVGPNEAFNVDVTDGVTVWGVAPAGKTILVKVLEIA